MKVGDPKLATIKSWFPVPKKSPVATPRGLVPVVMETAAWKGPTPAKRTAGADNNHKKKQIARRFISIEKGSFIGTDIFQGYHKIQRPIPP
jgi:hypothetical protein